MNKIGISEMISYILLISIGIALSIAVFSWLRTVSQDVKPPIDCKEETYITLEDFECTPGLIKLNLRNSGRFNISGIIMTVGNDSKGAIYYLKPDTSILKQEIDGQYVFLNPLAPGDVTKDTNPVVFKNTLNNGNVLSSINVIKLQPFIIVRNANKINKIVCTKAVTKQSVEGCNM